MSSKFSMSPSPLPTVRLLDPADRRQITDVALTRLSAGRPLTVATLGPAGTSSEESARYLGRRLSSGVADEDTGVRITLHDRYEQAADAVASGAAELLLVANAFAGIARFYMDPKLRLAAVFVNDTPQYGLAALPGSRPRSAGGAVADAEEKVRVATHPAPQTIVAELLPPGYAVAELVLVDSTSAAAAAVRSGEVPLALTTAPAARLYGLEFISPTRPIRMVWSVFTRTDLVEGPPA